MTNKTKQDDFVDPYTFIKQTVSLKDAAEKLSPESELKQVGSEERYDPCILPDCDSNSACKVNEPSDDFPYESFYCYSCGQSGTVIDYYMHVHKMDVEEDALEACQGIAKLFDLQLPSRGSSAVQRCLNDAADFYHQNLLDEKSPYSFLEGKTPLQYQIEVRGHTLESLTDFKVGWAKGGKDLFNYLSSVGYDKNTIASTGLLDSKKRFDFFSGNFFIYPFIYRRNVVRFKMKDETKQKKFQMRKDFYRNGSLFYNQSDLSNYRKILVVEGENDVISVKESDWDGGVIGTTGMPSREQYEFLKNHAMKAKAPIEYVSGFDNDTSGDKYREKLAFMGREMNQDDMKHIVTKDYKDLDLYLRNGGTMATAMKEMLQEPMDNLALKGIKALPGFTIVEKDGGYFRRKDGKDNEVFYEQLTDFILRMSHILIIRGERTREVKAIGMDGEEEVFEITSSCKTSKQMFESKIAATIDGTFWGRENDLKDIWRFIYATTPKRIVHVKDYCGHICEHDLDIWLFRNCAVERGGNVIMCSEDDGGIFWVNGNSLGVKPSSQRANATASVTDNSIPSMRVMASKEDHQAFTSFYLRKFEQNFGGNTLLTLILNGWAMSSAYSNTVFKELGEFPVLCLWGKYGRGKTTVTKWLQSLYGMTEIGATTVANLRSGVGMERKASYYSSLPISVDEIRNDRATKEHFAKFRGWYNRSARSMGSRDDPSKVVDVDVRSTFILTGEDLPEDSALRSRLIPLKLPINGGDDEEAYHWLNARAENKMLSSVGLYWVMQAMSEDADKFGHERRLISNQLAAAGCSARTSHVWSVVYLMARKLRDEFFPNYVEFEDEIMGMIMKDSGEQVETDTLTEFWETILILLAEERSPFTQEHITLSKGQVFIWMHAVHAIVAEKYSRENKELLSKAAIQQMIMETPYFIDEGRFRITPTLQKRGVKLDLNNAPEEVKSFMEYLLPNGGIGDSDLSNTPQDIVEEPSDYEV